MFSNILLSLLPLLPLYLGIYLLFLMRTDFDLTVAGSFSVASGVSGILLVNGAPVVVAMLGSVIVGGLLGLITATMNSTLQVPVFLGGLIMAIATYSITIRVMGNRPDLSLVGVKTIFSSAGSRADSSYVPLVILILVAVSLVAFALVAYFLKSEIGLSMRAAGRNSKMARANGYNDKAGIRSSLILGNSLAGLSGSLAVQEQGFAAATPSPAVVLSGLGAVVIGALILRPTTSKIGRIVLSVIVGGLIYEFVIIGALSLGLNPTDVNLVTGLTLVLAIAVEFWVRKILSKFRNRNVEEYVILDEAAGAALSNSIIKDD